MRGQNCCMLLSYLLPQLLRNAANVKESAADAERCVLMIKTLNDQVQTCSHIVSAQLTAT